MSGAADRARKCFALAHSTTHAGERDAALGRGLAIIKAAGLDPRRFKVPEFGQYSRETPQAAPVPPSPEHFIDPELPPDIEEAIRNFNASLEDFYLSPVVKDIIREAFANGVWRNR